MDSLSSFEETTPEMMQQPPASEATTAPKDTTIPVNKVLEASEPKEPNLERKTVGSVEEPGMQPASESQLKAQMESGFEGASATENENILGEQLSDWKRLTSSFNSHKWEGQHSDLENQNDGEVKKEESDFFDGMKFTQPRKLHLNLAPDVADPQMKYLENELGFKPRDIDMTRLLAADHPLLNKFQKSLKEQLVRRIEILRKDVGDLMEGCASKSDEKEVIGTEAYETNQTATKLGHSIRICLKDIKAATAACEELDCQLDKSTKEFDYEKEVNENSEAEEIAIRAEMESVDLLMKQMQNWEAELQNELMINQRSMDYTAKTKNELYQQQKEMDVILYSMMNDVWKLEAELEKVQMQIRVKEEDRERLAEAVALSNIDIDSNQTEHKCLVHGWQSVLVTINHRDKYYNNLLTELVKFEDVLSSANAELFHIKKEIQKEHMENERLNLVKERVDYEIKNVSEILKEETDKQDELLREIALIDKILEENAKQREILDTEVAAAKEQETSLTSELESLNHHKYQLERDILTHLQSNAFNNDACRQMANILKDKKEENRRMRINIARTEGQISITHARYQTLTQESMEVDAQLREIKSIINTEDQELVFIGKDYERSEKLLDKNILLYEQLKLRASGDNKDKDEMWPEEVKIRQLEATNTELIERNKQAQSFWLREQAIVVELSEKRQAQMKDIDLIKKQICVMDQKNLRINDTIENLGKLEETLTRSINNYDTKMNFITATLHKKRTNKTALELSNQKIKSEMQNKLEDSEFESLRLKAEIIEIEDDKYALSRVLIEKNREALCWEKKLIMVLDTRKQMHDSSGANGELSQMKTEIHRMNVRYCHLKRAQDKLIHDLDNCINRRDSIVTLAEARTKGHKGGSQQWRVNFNRRRDDSKNKLIQTEQELSRMSRKVELRESEVNKIQDEVTKLRDETNVLKKLIEEDSAKIEQSQINRQLSLDVLLYKQRKLKIYTELSRGRSPFLHFRTQSAAHDAYSRERSLNTKLRLIVEDMQVDLPDHAIFLTKLHNTLALPAVKL